MYLVFKYVEMNHGKSLEVNHHVWINWRIWNQSADQYVNFPLIIIEWIYAIFPIEFFFTKISSFCLHNLHKGDLLNEYNHTKFLEKDLCFVFVLERWYYSPAQEEFLAHQCWIASRVHEFHVWLWYSLFQLLHLKIKVDLLLSCLSESR